MEQKIKSNCFIPQSQISMKENSKRRKHKLEAQGQGKCKSLLLEREIRAQIQGEEQLDRAIPQTRERSAVVQKKETYDREETRSKE